MHLFVILIAIIIILYLINVKKENYNNNNQNKKLMCFYSNQCPHCHNLMKTNKWSNIEKHFAGSNVQVLKYEGETPEMTKYNISGYPTILLVGEDGSKIEYKGYREVADIIKFVENN